MIKFTKDRFSFISYIFCLTSSFVCITFLFFFRDCIQNHIFSDSENSTPIPHTEWSIKKYDKYGLSVLQTLLRSVDMEMRSSWGWSQLYLFEMLYRSCLFSNLLYQEIGVARKEKGKGHISCRLTESSASLVCELMENFLLF